VDAGDDEDDGALTLGELQPAGGTWEGLLFDNPPMGLAPFLSWSFTFNFGEVARSYGDTDVSVTVEWVPLCQLLPVRAPLR
jgi:hypothetical protein